MCIAAVLLRLQDTTAQIRVRGAFMLLVAFVALASLLGLETILGAFIAGVILRLVDGDQMMTHPQFRQKLEAVGFGVFIPVFFVTSGIRFDLAALFSSPSTMLRVPVFLVALLLLRGVPALLYHPLVGSRRVVVAGLLQATSLSFIVAASQIGTELGLITKAAGAALIAAGLLSVLIFPLLALTISRCTEGVQQRNIRTRNTLKPTVEVSDPSGLGEDVMKGMCPLATNSPRIRTGNGRSACHRAGAPARVH